MSNCSDHKNPLHNSGTSQPQRLLPGLDKDQFALADEKDFADWIVFAKEFAAFINYYDSFNKIAGDWQPFFSGDISAQLGNIAIQDINRYRLEIKERFDFLKDDDNAALLPELKIKLNELFSALLTLSKAIDNRLLKLPPETALQGTINNIVSTRLAPALYRLIAYYKGAKIPPLNLIDNSTLSAWPVLNQPLTDAGQIINADGLSDHWFDPALFPDWQAYVNSIAGDDSIFQNPLTGITDEFLSIEHAANHNLFSGIFDTYLTAYTKIIKDAETELLKTLENFDNHTPHYTLFLSFLKLFRFTQTQIKTITQRHLDFYYKEVLRLQPRPAKANQVHFLGELAKQVESYLLPTGTRLKAGKDSDKKEVNYSLEKDVVLNKAKVALLKTIYKAQAEDSIIDPNTNAIKQNNSSRIFASPIANSDDGLNPALTSPNKEWPPFVHKIFKDAQLDRIAMPKAQLGFAIASHYLFLTEGERKVFIRFVLNANSALIGKNFDCYLTTQKGWYKVDSLTISSAGKLSDNVTNCAEISFAIPGSAPTIVNYDETIHGGNFNVALPVLKIYLKNEDGSVYEYDALKDITLTKIEVRVEVGNDAAYNQKGIKNLLLSNDFGNIDPSKPFMPFGGQPEKDIGFVIGNKEIFSKENTKIRLNIEWAGLPDVAGDIRYEAKSSDSSSDVPACIPQMLSGGKWLTHSDDGQISSSEPLFNGVQQQVSLFSDGQVLPQKTIRNYQEEYNSLDAATVNGFLKLSLDKGFGYKQYISDLTLYLIEKSPDITDTISVQPVEPYTPKIKSLYAGYSAYVIEDLSEEGNFNERQVQFFHIYPFGEAEQREYLAPNEAIFLLPQFKQMSGGSGGNIGEFYIGLENLKSDEAVAILFQVMEGTTNPTVIKPADHITWSFLSNNHWKDFDASDVSDNTLQLVQSGIISFAIPKDATTQNTMLPTGYIWLRASITSAAEAVCELIAVNAQAALAVFTDNDNAPDFLDNQLPAGTIAKLAVPDSAIKKITQPYASFGGRPTESDSKFYIRVSERLRHKSRAITVWDYEHLVLEAFPEIYKVKCLNHTQIGEGIYDEVKPGYVSLITIPYLTNRNDANPLKPYTQQSTLTSIENFLSKKVSCFVKLGAFQPQFEEVRLEFSLKLYDDYKDFTFYGNLLKEEITKFLSPWAYGDNSKIDFGGKIYKSVLINFIEERYYVDFITDVFMYVKINDTTNESGNMEQITASTARSILVSAPASKHVIHEIIIDSTNETEACVDKNNSERTHK